MVNQDEGEAEETDEEAGAGADGKGTKKMKGKMRMKTTKKSTIRGSQNQGDEGTTTEIARRDFDQSIQKAVEEVEEER